MAISDAYVSVPEYRGAIGNEDPAGDLVLAWHLEACTRLYERETGQFFGRDAAAVTRVYEGNGTSCLKVDNIADTTGMTVKIDFDRDGSFADEDALAATDYEVMPLNAARGPEPKPWYEVHLTRWGTYLTWPAGYRVQVSAIWGWPAVPKAVKADVIELCAIWRKESPRATGRMNELEQVVSSSPMAMSLVKRFRNAYRVPVIG